METGAGVVLTTSFRYLAPIDNLHRMLLENSLGKAIAVLGETRDTSASRAAEKRDDLMFQVEFERWNICAPYQELTVASVGVFNASDSAWATQMLSIA